MINFVSGNTPVQRDIGIFVVFKTCNFNYAISSFHYVALDIIHVFE